MMKATVRAATSGKRKLAESMYQKGKDFLGASLLLRQAGGSEFVVLHLLCQGIEGVGKALLLFRDYDKYQPLLRKKKEFGHDLAKLVRTALDVFNQPHMEAELEGQLNVLNNFYTLNRLRYASSADILIDPCTIQSDLVWEGVHEVLSQCERHIQWASVRDE